MAVMPEDFSPDLFSAVVPAPFGGIGVRLDKGELRELVYLPPEYLPKAARDPVSKEAAAQVKAYLKDPDFTKEEIEALQIAAATVRLGAQQSELALWKLGAERVRPRLGPLASIGFSDPHLNVILDAIAKRAPVSFHYKGEMRTVDSYGMLARKGFWYLVGFDHLRKAQRVFRVDRIESSVKKGKAGSYTIPKNLNIANAVPTDRQMMASGDYEHATAHVRVDASLVRTVAREFGDTAKVRDESDGSAVFEIPCSNGYGFRLWLFAMVDKAEVVAPPEVRDMVVRWLDDLAERA